MERTNSSPTFWSARLLAPSRARCSWYASNQRRTSWLRRESNQRFSIHHFRFTIQHMRYRQFGRSGWQVSEIGYGMWGMGGGWSNSDDQQSLESLQAAVN